MTKQIIKDGNTTLIFDDSRADPAAVSSILADIGYDARRNIVAAAVDKEINTA